MPRVRVRQICNYGLNVAGVARSYGVLMNRKRKLSVAKSLSRERYGSLFACAFVDSAQHQFLKKHRSTCRQSPHSIIKVMLIAANLIHIRSKKRAAFEHRRGCRSSSSNSGGFNKVLSYKYSGLKIDMYLVDTNSTRHSLSTGVPTPTFRI